MSQTLRTTPQKVRSSRLLGTQQEKSSLSAKSSPIGSILSERLHLLRKEELGTCKDLYTWGTAHDGPRSSRHPALARRSFIAARAV